MSICGGCGHPLSAHETLDRAPDHERLDIYRYVTICTQDLDHVQGDSPWDHVCGCAWAHHTVTKDQVVV